MKKVPLSIGHGKYQENFCCQMDVLFGRPSPYPTFLSFILIPNLFFIICMCKWLLVYVHHVCAGACRVQWISQCWSYR